MILLAGLGMLALQAEPIRAQEAGVHVARLTPETETREPIGPLPRPLAFADMVRYRQIFSLQRAARWAEADRLIAELDDDLLLGHVLAGRYLDPTYRSSYVELVAWLERYADLPQAERIHRLALSKRPPKAPRPPKPTRVAPGEPDDQANDERERAGPRELWRRGLVAWRKGAAEMAAEHFARLTGSEGLVGEDLAGAAFWAARASLRAHQPQNVARFLRLAARSSDEFYGLLAQKMLDENIDFDWHEEQVQESMLKTLLRFPAAQRAIALGHVGERDLADDEARRLADRVRPDLAPGLMALAVELDLPSSQMRVAQALRRLDGRRHDGALFPLPRWQPAGGYKLDPSLVHAVIRAESGFDPDARSPRGALGLMQVMPDTGRLAARSMKIAYTGDASLLHPPTNMAVGQAWLKYLARTKTVDNSLIHLIAAYNAGENRLAGWLERELKEGGQDPLLFIESVPLAETRSYIKRVLANLWAYQARAGQPIPSLQALAENRWPEVALAATIEPTAKGKKQLHARAN
jgi:soluble lytic murein transglycosylase-like protein